MVWLVMKRFLDFELVLYAVYFEFHLLARIEYHTSRLMDGRVFKSQCGASLGRYYTIPIVPCHCHIPGSFGYLTRLVT
jgi:hypothetical protein